MPLLLVLPGVRPDINQRLFRHGDDAPLYHGRPQSAAGCLHIRSPSVGDGLLGRPATGRSGRPSPYRSRIPDNDAAPLQGGAEYNSQRFVQSQETMMFLSATTRWIAGLGVLAGLDSPSASWPHSNRRGARRPSRPRRRTPAARRTSQLLGLPPARSEGFQRGAAARRRQFLNQWGDKTVADLHTLSDGLDAADQLPARPAVRRWSTSSRICFRRMARGRIAGAHAADAASTVRAAIAAVADRVRSGAAGRPATARGGDSAAPPPAPQRADGHGRGEELRAGHRRRCCGIRIPATG